MKSQSPLITLRDLAQDAVEQAAQQLGQVRQAQQAAEQQLSMLLNYQDEYRQKLNHTLCDGMVSSSATQCRPSFAATAAVWRTWLD